jgi:hypothetical protein
VDRARIIGVNKNFINALIMKELTVTNIVILLNHEGAGRGLVEGDIRIKM